LFGQSSETVTAERIGYLPQSFTPHERLTVDELAEYYAGLYTAPRSVDDVLADVGLTDARDARYESLSGGQQRRLCVGISLINDPDVLFLDEPTTGIDPVGRREVWSLVESLADGGTTVFLTTHFMDEAEVLADRVGILVEGELVDEGTPTALIDRYVGDAHLSVEVTSEVDAAQFADAPFDVTSLGSRLEFEGVSPADLPAAMEFLADLDVTFTDVSWSTPTLEDVYLRAAEEGAVPASRRHRLVSGGIR
jgi:ABC-2 type transport system ATP-binding protein